MIISKTSQYAIQALIYIATQNRYVPVLNRAIAKQLGIPSAYQAKIMQRLSHGGLVTSFRGRQGGFLLSEAPEKISLMRVLLITEGVEYTKDCVLGLKVCSDETACPMHNNWMPTKEEIVKMLNQQTLETLSEAVISGKYRICDIHNSFDLQCQK